MMVFLVYNKFSFITLSHMLLFAFVTVSCGEPSHVPNSIRTGTSFTFGSSVHYQCNTGYYISGSSDRMCQSSGTWSEQAPSCNGTWSSSFKLELYILNLIICKTFKSWS